MSVQKKNTNDRLLAMFELFGHECHYIRTTVKRRVIVASDGTMESLSADMENAGKTKSNLHTAVLNIPSEMLLNEYIRLLMCMRSDSITVMDLPSLLAVYDAEELFENFKEIATHGYTLAINIEGLNNKEFALVSNLASKIDSEIDMYTRMNGFAVFGKSL